MQKITKDILFQKLRIKRPRQQFAHHYCLTFSFEVGENYRDIAAEFPDDLAADSAGWGEVFGVDDDGDLGEAGLAARDSFPDGDAFGADGEAVAGGFDVAADVDVAILGFDSGADLEIRIRCVGPGSGGRGRVYQFLFLFHLLVCGARFFAQLFADHAAQEFDADTRLAAFGNDDVGISL